MLTEGEIKFLLTVCCSTLVLCFILGILLIECQTTCDKISIQLAKLNQK